jgi:putative transposase
MARKPRIEFEGAFYHVITRGNQRQKIFREDADYNKYLLLLTVYKNRYRYSLYAYALMSNHVHLLIETRDIPLSKILQGINQSYTLYFNHKYKTIGHLFQGRYKAILCDRENYLLSLLKYIHNNPIRARIAESPDAYPWISHQAYIGKKNPLGIVDIDQVLRMFSESKNRARRHYRAFMDDKEALKKEEVYATIDQRLQGNEEFVDRVLKEYEGEIKKERRKKEYTLSSIRQVIEKRYSVSLAELRSSGKESRVMRARRLFTLTAKEYGYSGRELAAYLTKDPASISGYIRGENLSKEVGQVVKMLGYKN